MKILVCHNYYQQPGGEDQSFAAEADLLESHGHEVLRYTRHNDDIEAMGRLDIARRTLWNQQSYDDLQTIIRRHRPDVMHCTNIFPLISPAAYYAAQRNGVPVVQSLRNYRLLCVNSLLARDGRVCEDCLGKRFAWPGVLHRCYRGSRAGSAVVASMIAAHRLRRTWTKAVDCYVALTEFAREKYIQGGLPAEKIVIKPNFVSPDPGPGTGRGGYALFVGRLSEEKGIHTLLAAWSKLQGAMPLRIVGDGPLQDVVRSAAERDTSIEWIGRQTPTQVRDLMGEAAALVFPSTWYEGQPRTIIEAFSRGTPVVSSRLGSMRDMIAHGRTGLHFEPGNVDDLVAQIRRLTNEPSLLDRMRDAARAEYVEQYTAEPNYRAMMAIYERVCGRRLSNANKSLVAAEVENAAV